MKNIDVLLLKAYENSSSIISEIQKLDISFYHLPIMKIFYCAINAENLQQSINNSDFILITSENALYNLTNITKPLLLVGSKLNQICSERFQCEILYTANNIRNLVYYLNNNHLYDRKILYLRGKNITYDLKKNCPNLQEIIVYSVNKLCSAEEKLKDLLLNHGVKFNNILLFSKRYAQYLQEIIHKYSLIKYFSNTRFFF